LNVGVIVLALIAGMAGAIIGMLLVRRRRH